MNKCRQSDTRVWARVQSTRTMGNFLSRVHGTWWRQSQWSFSTDLVKLNMRTTRYQRQEQWKRTLVFAATTRLKSLPLAATDMHASVNRSVEC